MATMNVSLPDPMKEWVDEQSKGGRYGNASDYVRDLIRRDQKRQEAHMLLQAAISLGDQSGDAAPLDVAKFKQEMRRRHVVD